jgi:hypothetical protein
LMYKNEKKMAKFMDIQNWRWTENVSFA